MNSPWRRISFLLLLALWPAWLGLCAQSVYRLEVGRSLARDTYLSPLRYSGVAVGLSGEWWLQLPRQDNALRFGADLSGAPMSDKSRFSHLYDLGVAFDCDYLHTWHPLPALSLGAGAGLGLEAGALWLPANGNNPASARAQVAAQLVANASYRLKIGRLPVTISDACSLPSLGILFCQGYGQSYYEIYLGERDELLHCGWWGNSFRLDNRLTATLHFGRRALELGYRFRYRSSYVNHLNRTLVTHAFTLGIAL